MLSSRLQAEGPIWKGRTSFNIAARASYFNWIVEPMLKKIYDNEDALAEYSHMNYYDITAKVVHRLTNKDKLSASFYYGKDVNNEAPQTSSGNSSRSIQEEKYILSTRRVHSNTADNNWNNIVGGLTWNHFFNKGSAMYTRLNFSRYKYDMDYTAHTEETTERIYFAIKNDDNKLLNQQTITDPKTSYSSGITDLSLSSGLNTRIHDKHDLKAGIDLSYKKVSPSIDAYRYVYTKKLRGITSPLTDPLYDETEEIKQSKTDDGRDLYTASAYAEDDIDWNRYIKTNIGVRASYYGVDGKSYIYIEPRLSLRFLLREGMSVKLGYARMTQGIHQLASSNITSPSDIWVSATKNIAPSTADQLSVGYEYELPHDISLSVEGYYKKMDDLLDYMDGSSFINSNGKWENLVAVGKGKSYGVEFLLQKMTGMTTGWISYTYQRSLRTFDKPGMELNGGKEFKATSDQPHNFNIVLTQQLGKHWDFSLSWTYQSGRRGTLTNLRVNAGQPDEYNAWGIFSPLSSAWVTYATIFGMATFEDPQHTSLNLFRSVETYRERNSYKLPDTHHLDISVGYHINHGWGESVCKLSVYNVYNRQNISSVYIGYEGNKTVLKGICRFPLLPSVSYSLNF